MWSSLSGIPSCRTRAARVLHAGIRASELVVLEGVGHMSFAEDQDAYIEAVRRFLRGAALGG